MPSNRRDFLKTSVTAVAAGVFAGSSYASGAGGSSAPGTIAAEGMRASANKGVIFSAYKGGKLGATKEEMVKTLTAAKKLGFDGIEGSGISDVNALKAAIQETQYPVSGLVGAHHWRVRMSDPDPKVREKSRLIFEGEMQAAYEVRASSVLLVPGKVTGKDETHCDVWKRSIVEIQKMLPLASRLGVQILIENVWNGFCETPKELKDYIDEINSPWVGVHFDIGNVRKFGPPEEWIRILGKRIVKLDIKDWGKKNSFCRLGDGDVNWLEVRKALKEINFHGWATREGQSKDKGLTDTIQLMNINLDL